MDDDKKDSDDAVGYCKPPKHTRFQPGQSGNPKGRPRKSITFADDLETVLSSRVIVTENGKPRKITKRRAIATQHVHKAMNGNIRSTKLLLECLHGVQSDPHNNLSELVEEFRNRDHRLKNDRVEADDDSASLTDGRPGPKGNKS